MKFKFFCYFVVPLFVGVFICMDSCCRAVIAVGRLNDHRLGANEAPPCYFYSVYLVSKLESVFNDIKAGKVAEKARAVDGFGTFTNPKIVSRSWWPRNRTSAFAFHRQTRFEFSGRFGSSQSVSGPARGDDTMLADSLDLDCRKN